MAFAETTLCPEEAEVAKAARFPAAPFPGGYTMVVRDAPTDETCGRFRPPLFLTRQIHVTQATPRGAP